MTLNDYLDDLMICKLFERQLSTVCTYFCGLCMLLLVSGQTDGTIEQDEQRTRGRQNRGRSLGRGRLNLLKNPGKTWLGRYPQNQLYAV